MKSLLRHASSLIAAIVLIGIATNARAIEFNEIARFDVSFAFAANIGEQDPPNPDNNPKYIGTNPLGVAWNGSQLYLAGFDNFGTSELPVGLIEVLNPTRTGVIALEDADFSAAFAPQFQPIGRGYTGIAIQGNRLAAAYDDGAPVTGGIQLFDTTDNSLIWDIGSANSGQTARGGSGVAFDPGFGGDPSQGGGVAWTTFGSGRRALQDTATGATVFDLDGTVAQGMQWLTDGSFDDNFARDMAFDPDTGDVYVRRSNDIDVAIRTGANATTDRATLVDGGAGPFVLGHKIEFLSDTDDGDLLIYNDRPADNPPTAFVDAVKVIDTAGVEQSATFNLIGGGTGADIGEGSAIYDFDYDEASGTLALLDFNNRNVFIFQVGGPAGLVGDYNGDLVVDAADYTVWRDTRGDSVLNPGDGADGNQNGVIDDGDYDEWVANFGAGSAPAAAVPEPGAMMLALLTTAGLLSKRSRFQCATE